VKALTSQYIGKVNVKLNAGYVNTFASEQLRKRSNPSTEIEHPPPATSALKNEIE